tara:strand:- start:1990 stop:2709 length:720 start_codon:yes stop_codon:yes gene_type:complete
MIHKNLLQSAIQKYFLSGRHQMVKWRIKNNTLTVYAGEAGRACKVTLKDFPLQDSELGIFDTDKLARLLAITSGDLLLSLQGQKELHNILNIADAHFDLTYTLADPLTIGRNQWVEDPDTFEVEIDLEKEDITHIIKAKSALSESPNMLITTKLDDGNPICEFIFGDMSGYANKIAFKLQGNITKTDMSIPFDAELVKDIFNVNKDVDSATLKVSEKGLLKLVFTNESIESVYYVLRNE